MNGRRRHFGRNSEGATAIEYALLACMIGVAIITALSSVNRQLLDTWQAVLDLLAGA